MTRVTTSDGSSAGLRVTRRKACAIGLSAAAGAALPPLAAAPALAAAPSALRFAISDRRHPESLAFAEALAGHGVRRLETTGGLTRLWLEDLLPLWRGKGGAIAGITLFPTFVGLAEQARSHGRRSTLLAQHAIGADGAPAAHLARVQNILPATGLLQQCGGAWPQLMAEIVLRRDALGTPTAIRRRPPQQGGADAVADRTLVSWIIE